MDSFVPVLVGLLNHGSNPDIMLLAARALTHLVDVLPSSCAAVVHYGAVSCFVARLLIIEYMDLVEQVTVYSFVPTRSLQALKKISQEDPTACLRAAALMVVISYLNFFSTGVQRVELATAANMCKKLPLDTTDFEMEATQRAVNDGKTRLKIEISIPELNPAMDVYRIGMQMELIRVLALSFADDGKRVKVCVRGSMGEGALAGTPLQLAGSQKILEFMDWGDYGALGTFVNIGFIVPLPHEFSFFRFYVRDIFVESANLLVELAGLPNP
ncbi:Adenylate kinase 5, chloroplastic [Capsicum chinense]|nr:Adenylate kinase 5, chloroplastic [Capsicum chinense]